MSCNQNCDQGRNCNCSGVHVVPVNDLREHQHNGSCWCKPRHDDDSLGNVWIHNSMDGREAFENGERLPT